MGSPWSPLTRAHHHPIRSDPMPHPPTCLWMRRHRRLGSRSSTRRAILESVARRRSRRGYGRDGPPAGAEQTNTRTNKRTSFEAVVTARPGAGAGGHAEDAHTNVSCGPVTRNSHRHSERARAPFFCLRLCMQVNAELLKQLEDMGFPTVGSPRVVRPSRAAVFHTIGAAAVPPTLAPPLVRARGRAHACAHDPHKARPRM